MLPILVLSWLAGLITNDLVAAHLPGKTLIFPKEKMTFEGVVASPPQIFSKKSYLTIDVTSGNFKGKIRLTVGERVKEIYGGEAVRFETRLKGPVSFRNPGVRDFAHSLARKGITAIAFVERENDLTCIGGRWWGEGFRAVGEAREEIARRLALYARPRVLALIEGATFGETASFSDDDLTAFREAGIAHLLAVSGTNVAFVAFLFFALFRFLFSRSERLLLKFDVRKVSAVLTLLPVFFYFALSGGTPSAARATIMVTVYLASIFFERDGEIFNSLALAALIILACQPSALFEISFQLSFAAVGAIAFAYGRLKKRPGFFLSLFVTSSAAVLGVWPLISYYFYEISWAGILTNMFFVPFMGFVILPLSFLGEIAVFLAPPLATAVFWLVNLSGLFYLEAVRLTADYCRWAIIFGALNLWEVTAYYLLIGFLFYYRRLPWRRVVLSTFAVILLVYTGVTYVWPHLDPRLHVTFLDVGQGDSTFIRFPHGKTMLIDGGGQLFKDESGIWNEGVDIGRVVLVPYLLGQKVRRIDYLVLSHPHSDHYGGLRAAAKYFKVGEFWTSGFPSDEEPYLELLSLLKGIPESSPPFVFEKEIEGVRVQTLFPEKITPKWRENDNSLVVKLSRGDVSFLFPGDAGRAVEEDLIAGRADLKSTVLKVAHHGGKGSSSEEFIRAVSPRYAVISVGKNNRHKLPNGDVLEKYRRAGTAVYRTDISGAVRFDSDGIFVRVTSHQRRATAY